LLDAKDFLKTENNRFARDFLRCQDENHKTGVDEQRQMLAIAFKGGLFSNPLRHWLSYWRHLQNVLKKKIVLQSMCEG